MQDDETECALTRMEGAVGWWVYSTAGSLVTTVDICRSQPQLPQYGSTSTRSASCTSPPWAHLSNRSHIALTCTAPPRTHRPIIPFQSAVRAHTSPSSISPVHGKRLRRTRAATADSAASAGLRSVSQVSFSIPSSSSGKPP